MSTGTVRPEGEGPVPARARGNAFERWIVARMHSRWAYPALFLGVLIESTVFPWPVEFALAAMMLEARTRVLPVTGIAVLGSVVGAGIFFLLGAFFYEGVGQGFAETMGWSEAVEKKRAIFRDHGFWIVILAAQLPLPFQVTAMAAGVSGYALGPFLLAALAGRGIRYGLMAVPVYFLGPSLRTWWRCRPRWVRRAVVGGLLVAFAASLVLPFLM